MRSINFRLLILFIAVAFLASCASSKKFDFASAYKFRTIKHHPSTVDTEKPDDKQLEASTVAETSDEINPSEKLTEAENKILEKTGLKTANEQITKAEVQERVAQLAKKEKRKLRRELIRELKSEMKQMNTMGKSAYMDDASINEVADLTGYTRTGAIIGGLGIIVLILGALFGVGALTLVGSLLIIGGVIFILVDLL